MLRRLPLLLVLPVIGACFTANPFLTVLCIVVAAVLPLILWRPGEPPVLLFCLAVQLLQVSTVLLYADFAQANLVAAFGGIELQMAVALGLIGLVVLSLGVRLGMGRWDRRVADQAEEEALQISVPTALTAYVASFAASSFLRMISGQFPQATQALVAIATVKWAFLFLLCLSVIQQRRNYAFLWAAVGLEFFAGLLGYFSSFKNVFFLLIIVMLASRHLWNLKRVLLSVVVCLLLVVSSIIWSAIKEDYRDFLNQGSRMQEVVVPIPARVDKLQELVGGLTDEGFFQGVEALISRVGYVTYFALTIGNVPDRLPHENGQLWLGAVKHVLMPRAFFPGKGIIDDSERTSYYTGIRVAGMEQGTSISVGYMGESYIDFGRYGMFVPIFLLGVLFGLIYRVFVKYARFKVVGFAAATSVLLFSAYNFETSNIKILGGMLAAAIITGIFMWLAEPTLARWLNLQR
jgi:hypothetical protein